MSNWTSKRAIMRDLAVAQGFDVPADLEGIGANDKPPALNIPEDTGEDYFGHCEGEGDCSGPPDLALIQHMLNMVRDVDISNCEDNPDQVVQISKPSNLNIRKDITSTKTGTIPKTIKKNVKPQAKKVKKKRENCAVNSILLAMAGDTPVSNMEHPKEPLKLLKPTDFMTGSSETDIVQSVQKVNGWLDTQVPIKSVEKVDGWSDTQLPSISVSRFSGNPLTLEPGLMFKKRNKSSGSSLKSTSPQKQALTILSYNPSMLPEDAREHSSMSRVSSCRVALELDTMFMKKSSLTVKSPEMDTVKSFSPQQQVPSTIGSYKPSMLAGAYYQKYVERNKIKELIQEDIWTCAERVMKELDAKKKLEAKAAAKEVSLNESTIDVTAIDTTIIDEVAINTTIIDEAAIDTEKKVKIPEILEFLQIEKSSSNQNSPISGCDLIELPRHRHLVTGKCTICKVVTAHGYDVDT